MILDNHRVERDIRIIGNARIGLTFSG